MKAPRSVAGRLKRDLAVVALAGSALLLAAALFLYWAWISDMPADEARLRAVRELLEHVGLPLLVLMAPVVVVGLRVIRLAFQPLATAAAAIEHVAGDERGFRIDGHAMPAEALPFVAAVNGLLARLDAAAQQQEAFAADVAHELRTPLALLALELDSLPAADAARLKADVAAMQRLVGQLLLLAQIDAGLAARTAPMPVILAEVAGEVVAAMAPAIIAGGRTIALTIAPPASPPGAGGAPMVVGRREAIAAALRNLVENAVRVTPAGGAIRVTAGPGPQLAVGDGGPGLTAARLADLARRHHRADHASHDGAGLGLAIVTRIMAAHGGRLETDPDARTLSLHF